jgi:anti-sigma factor (TIGR02949 family)
MSEKKKMVIVVTSGFNDERSSVAWNVANGAVATDFHVTMFLVSSGVDWVRRGAADHEHHSDTRDIGCLEAIEALYAWLDGELGDPETIAQVECHLQHCQHCFSRSQMERALSEHIRAAAKQKAPDGLQDRMRKLLDEF